MQPQPFIDGDTGWLGVNHRLHPAQIPAGYGAYGENLRFTEGKAETRRGARIMAWAAQWDATSAAYQAAGTPYVKPYVNIAAGGTFNDPATGDSWLVVVTRDPVTGVFSAFRSQPGITAWEMPSPEGETIPARVKLIQTYDGLVMLRGKELDPLYLPSVISGFRTCPAASTPGNTKIPPSSHGVYFQNRLFCVDARDDIAYRDTVWVSDFGGVASVLEGNGSWNNFKINVGSRDRLVGVYKFNDTTAICAKTGSIYAVSGIGGTNDEIQASARLDEITTEYGCQAPDSFVQVGSDLWFLAHRRGIVSIAQTSDNKLQGVDVPKSRDIEKLISRINWEHAGNAVSAFYGNRAFFAVPLDSSTENNAVLVYDTTTQAWAGVDLGDAIRPKDWLKYLYGGTERLHYLHSGGYLYLYDDGFLDHVADDGLITYASIPTVFRTRGYGGTKSLRRQKHERISASVRTWWPTYSISAVYPGQDERQVLLTDETTDRTKWVRPHGRADFVADNSADEYNEPHREDYSLMVPTPGVNPGTTLEPDIHQEWTLEKRVHVRSESVQFEFANIQGRLEVAQCGLSDSKVLAKESTVART